MSRALALLLALFYSLLAPGSARAHDPFELTTEALVRTDSVVLTVTMTLATARRLGAAPLFRVYSVGEQLVPPAPLVTTNADSEQEFRITLPLPRAGPLRLEATHLHTLPEGYLNAVTVRDERTQAVLAQKFLHAGDDALEVTLAATARSEPPPAWRFLTLGVHHVLTGYDHLLFLAGIIVTCRRLKPLLVLVSSFTVAHALTLAASLLGNLDAPSHVVEPIIAASIVFVGAENLLSRGQPRARYAITFGFGLIHGLGFAAALRDLGLGSSSLVPLISFNLGVEVAQLLIAAALLPPLWLLERRGLAAPLVRGLSLAIAVAGAYWFFERTGA